MFFEGESPAIIVSIKIFVTSIWLKNSSDLIMPPLLKRKALLLLLRNFLKTGLVFLAVHKVFSDNWGKFVSVEFSSHTFAKILK